MLKNTCALHISIPLIENSMFIGFSKVKYFSFCQTQEELFRDYLMMSMGL
jgi:hypothetical protein